MLGKDAREKIKRELKLFGKSYVTVIQEYLRKNEIYNSKGKEFSASMIRAVLNSPMTHHKLESAIFECLEECIKARQEEEERRKKLLSEC